MAKAADWDSVCRLHLTGVGIHINQLCVMVGIDDPYYFSRLFTRLAGCSPQVCRKQHGRKSQVVHDGADVPEDAV